jgi:two-component system response regulator
MENTILIVDDNSDDLEITKRALAKTGLALTIAEALRGEFALEQLRKWSALPRLIFLDLKMPGMNGIETLREIRQDVRLKHLPVVILTNSKLDADRQEACDAGADGFVHKAFDIDQLCEDLKFVLTRCLTS